MINKIEQDHARFRQIVKGRIRRDLKRFIARGEFIGREGKRLVSVPVQDIDLPTLRYGDNSGGVGAGEGKEGDEVGPGKGRGGEQEGRHILEVDVSLDELADMLGEELALPRIRPKGAHHLTTVRDRYTGVRPVGPASLRHFKRTYRQALKRQLTTGTYDPQNPVVVPIKDDLRFRSWNEVRTPQSNAVIVLMMDVSGSMGDEQKHLVRLHAFWIDTWLRRNYAGVETRYIVHDVSAREVDRATFFSLREDGGTKISSALGVCREVLGAHYPAEDWNIYVFHFSDGDNSSDADNRVCCEMLAKHLLPIANMFGYCQVKSAYGSGHFYQVLRDAFPPGSAEGTPAAKVVSTKVNEREDIYESLRQFFKAGR
ncbi:MAG: hypothetical protein C0475_03345 [Planctomyces sp.]|nr:hypothetical protein [Planctomyces sp.]MBA4039068.1 hypothetical protein [Planctomyces sp.]MBA4119492.1 hypothetical protein [Isosphaera sp.]